ncbi:hypothetical protein BH10ACT3_BH10ACT3_11990 [soil metagenome]
MNTHTSVRGPTSTERMVRTALPFGVALVVSAPTVMHAVDGTGSWMTVALVGGVTLSIVWVLCAIGLSMLSGDRRPTHAGTAAPNSAPTTAATADGAIGTGATINRLDATPTYRPSATSASQPLARIPVARVPADQAMHADVDGHVTAATSTMGVVR